MHAMAVKSMYRVHCLSFRRHEVTICPGVHRALPLSIHVSLSAIALRLLTKREKQIPLRTIPGLWAFLAFILPNKKTNILRPFGFCILSVWYPGVAKPLRKAHLMPLPLENRMMKFSLFYTLQHGPHAFQARSISLIRRPSTCRQSSISLRVDLRIDDQTAVDTVYVHVYGGGGVEAASWS